MAGECPVSVAILAKNEETFIGRCVTSALWADEVLVLDTGSTDRTMEIARSLGATVYERPWSGNWSEMRNVSICLAQHDWVLFIDADEIVTPELACSIRAALSRSPDPRDGYHVQRPSDMLGVLLANEARPSKQAGFIRLLNRRFNLCDEAQKVHESITPVGRARPLYG